MHERELFGCPFRGAQTTNFGGVASLLQPPRTLATRPCGCYRAQLKVVGDRAPKDLTGGGFHVLETEPPACVAAPILHQDEDERLIGAELSARVAGGWPPRIVSSISTVPDSFGRSGRTMAVLILRAHRSAVL